MKERNWVLLTAGLLTDVNCVFIIVQVCKKFTLAVSWTADFGSIPTKADVVGVQMTRRVFFVDSEILAIGLLVGPTRPLTLVHVDDLERG